VNIDGMMKCFGELEAGRIEGELKMSKRSIPAINEHGK
jgi:hypothetical protein